VSGRVITPCVHTLQSLGTVTGASHQELQCPLHHPDIESRVVGIILYHESLISYDGCDEF